MKKLLLLLAPLFLVMTFAPGQGRADQIAGSQYPYLGYGIRYFPLGGSGVADFTSMESGLYNPAAFGDVRRVTAGVSLGGLGSDYFLLNSRVSFPTNYGVLSGVFQTLESPSATDVGDIYGGKLIFSKLISDEWLFGAALNLGSVSGGPETGLYLSSDIGTIYRKSVEGSGFGIFDHSIGVAFRNLGKNISYDDFDGVPPLELDLGARAEIVRSGFYRGIISSHLGFPLNPFNTFYGVGVENVLFDTVSLKAGLNFGIEDIEPYSFGVDVFFNIKDTDFTLSYSLLPTKFPDGSTEYVHNAGVSVAFGRYDKKPPEAAVNVQNVYFSPNHDGINDRGRFNMSIRDNTLVFGWKLDIVDDGGRPVKTFEAQDVRKIRRMTLKKYVSRIFARKQEVEIPESIEWDGQDEEGNEVPDGTYHYTLTAWDENENRTVTQRGSLIVDTLVPIVEAKADDLLFSPNGDGAKETITIDVESANIEPDDEVTFLIEDRDGNAVYREVVRGWKGTHYVWDGRNSSGGLVDEGLYRFSVTALDRAANRTESTVEGIYVRTGYENVSVSPSMKAFSPNGDGHSDIDEIKLFTSGKEGLTFWQLAVVDESGKTMRLFEGGQDFPDVISYDGKTDGGRVLPDGLYTLQFKLLYESGNHPESFYKFLRIDNTPPSIAVDLSTTAFSPNGDGVKDTMTINNEIRADEGDTFEARITNAAGAVFRTLQYGTKPPRSVVWDGTGDGGTLPVEGTYTYTITGRDQVGNVTTVSSKSIKLVTGFEEVAVEPAYHRQGGHRELAAGHPRRVRTACVHLRSDQRGGDPARAGRVEGKPRRGGIRGGRSLHSHPHRPLRHGEQPRLETQGREGRHHTAGHRALRQGQLHLAQRRRRQGDDDFLPEDRRRGEGRFRGCHHRCGGKGGEAVRMDRNASSGGSLGRQGRRGTAPPGGCLLLLRERQGCGRKQHDAEGGRHRPGHGVRNCDPGVLRVGDIAERRRCRRCRSLLRGYLLHRGSPLLEDPDIQRPGNGSAHPPGRRAASGQDQLGRHR
jgi:flagellar hook assembly protein FlgD